jgi:serine/threonine-protein kinase
VSARPDPGETPDVEDRTLPEDEWPVPEQYRAEERRPVEAVESDTAVTEAVAPPEAPVAGPPARRFPPDISGGILAALLGVLLVAILVPAGIWLASYYDDESDTNRPETATQPTTQPPTTRTVPQVVGLRLPEARERLRDGRLDVRVRRVASQQPPGEVLRQAPARGAEAPQNGVVTLTVSSGPRMVVLPRVEGSMLVEATATLRDLGVRWEIQRVSSSEPEGTVLAQTPSAGEEVDRREIVVVLEVAERPAATTTEETTTTTSEPETVGVPDLVGLSSAEARSRLGELGLRWTQRPLTSSRPQGTVVRQSPVPGAEVREGGRVTLTVSTGPARVEVPDVVGLDERSARQELRAAGFRVQVAEVPTTDDTEDGIVRRQQPRGGASRPKGSVVTITVARF